jgi:hypothetical protein
MFTFVKYVLHIFVFSLGFPGLLPGFLFYTKKLKKNFRSESPINIDFLKIYSRILNIIFYICTNKETN